LAENFYTILTATGKAKLANSAVLGSKVNFKTLKVGDGKGAYYEPSENQTSLVNQVWSGNISSISVDESNPNWIVIETIIPAAIGGFFIREAGIFDEAGDLIAISKLSETYKPVVTEGSIKDLCIKIILEVSNVESVTLKIDPTIILAKKSDVEELRSEINTQLSDFTNGVKTTAALTYGMNNVIRKTSKVPSSPKFTIQGKTLINLLGKDGNCEDVSEWVYDRNIATLDSTNKMFGSSGFKLTLTATAATYMYKEIPNAMDLTKYYLMSAYVKNGNLSTGMRIYKDNRGGGNQVMGTTQNESSKFVRVGIVVAPTDLKSGDGISIMAIGNSGEYGYCDGIMIKEITASEYALGTALLLDKYPYVDSYTCLTNPYAEIRRNNLVRNGNCEEGVGYWNTDSATLKANANGGFNLVANVSISNAKAVQIVKVKPNTNYTLIVTFDTNTDFKIDVCHRNPIYTNIYNASTGGTFNSGNCGGQIEIAIYTATSLNSCNFGRVMLVEGTVAPATYKTCKIQRTVIEGRFADGDNVIYKDGKVSGLLNWEHKTLYGKDYDWQWQADFTGYKQLSMPLLNVPPLNSGNVISPLVKYDGSLCVFNAMSPTAKDQYNSYLGRIYISIADSDTGWTETLNPNNDEVKAFMNGWRAVFNTSAGGGRYIAWTHFTGSSSFLSADTSASTTNSNVVNFSSHSFAVGDLVVCPYASGTIFTVTAITNTTITLNANITVGANQTFFKSDDGTSTKVLNYCINNVAPGYEGYQLHYKLANPEPITDLNVHVEGDILTLEEGENYVYLDSGMVLGEVANPKTSGTNYYIGYDKILDAIDSPLLYRSEIIKALYKNGINDLSKWEIFANAYDNNALCISNANFDTTATYTLDYKILATIAPQIGAIVCEYVEDIISAINSLQEAVGSRQIGNSTLDDIVDMSLYEKFSNGYISGVTTLGMSYTPSRQYYETTNMAEAKFFIPFKVEKAVVPKINLTNFSIYIMDSTGTATYIKSVPAVDSTIRKIAFDISKIGIVVSIVLYAGTNANNALANGMFIGIQGIADCRERV
jgi:DUF971 family protein